MAKGRKSLGQRELRAMDAVTPKNGWELSCAKAGMFGYGRRGRTVEWVKEVQGEFRWYRLVLQAYYKDRESNFVSVFVDCGSHTVSLGIGEPKRDVPLEEYVKGIAGAMEVPDEVLAKKAREWYPSW
jgi:hypothetical protein